MSTTASVPDPNHSSTGSGHRSPAIVRSLQAGYDPEWLPFMAFALVPALFCLLEGELQKAKFFAGMAIYLGVLKWLGWALLTRRSVTSQRYALFPAEIFAGLAVACFWFYLRNAMARLVPASYSLAELGLLAPALAVLHLLVGLSGFRVVGRGQSPFPSTEMGTVPKAPGMRNAVARLVPASYSLAELGLLAPALGALHLLVILTGIRKVGRGQSPFPSTEMETVPSAPALSWSEIVQGFVHRTAAYLPFFFILTLALWQVSGSLAVQGGDALRHGFQARVALHDGLLYPHFSGGQPIVYTSAFAAMNAVAASVAPLTVVQAVNLQHVVVIVLGLFLVPAALGLLAPEPMPFIQSMPLAFLSLFPLYALFPYCIYEGPPRQAAPGLLIAICLIPAVVACASRAEFYILLGTEAALTALPFAVNPACVPFVAVAGLVATAVLWRRAKSTLGLGLPRVARSFLLLTALAFGLVLTTDAYYQSLLVRRVSTSAPAPPADAAPVFSLQKGVQLVAAADPFDFRPMTLDSELGPLGRFNGWASKTPQWLFPRLAIALSLLACGCWALQWRKGKSQEAWALGSIVATCLVLWLVLVYPIGVFQSSIEPASWTLYLLRVYAGILRFRFQLVVLFTASLASAVYLYLVFRAVAGRAPLSTVMAVAPALAVADGWDLPELTDPRFLMQAELAIVLLVILAVGISVNLRLQRSRPPGSGPSLLSVAGILVYLAPFVLVVLDPSPSGLITLQEHPNGSPSVTAQDLELVAWMDEHISPENNIIGLTPRTWRAPPPDPQRYFHPIGASQALFLYSKRYNYCFCPDDPVFADSYEEYTQHIENNLDVDWCLKHKIHYFFVAAGALAYNPGPAAAIADGRLKPVRELSSCALYGLAGRPVQQN